LSLLQGLEPKIFSLGLAKIVYASENKNKQTNKTLMVKILLIVELCLVRKDRKIYILTSQDVNFCCSVLRQICSVLHTE